MVYLCETVASWNAHLPRSTTRCPNLTDADSDFQCQGPQGAGVEEKRAHSFGPRISRITSLSGLPPARSRIARAFSNVRVDCAASAFSSGLSSVSRPAARRASVARSRSSGGVDDSCSSTTSMAW